MRDRDRRRVHQQGALGRLRFAIRYLHDGGDAVPPGRQCVRDPERHPFDRHAVDLAGRAWLIEREQRHRDIGALEQD